MKTVIRFGWLLMLMVSFGLQAQVLNTDSISETESVEATEAIEETESASVPRTIDKKEWDQMTQDKRFKYKVPEPKKEVKRKKKDLSWLKTLGQVIKFLLFAMVIVILGFIIYYIIRNSEFNYFRNRKKTSPKPEVTSYENVYTYQEWELALQKALEEKNYRLAIRILYLETLQKLHFQQLIQYEQDRTNWDYVKQLQGSDYQQPFTGLTKYFDYVWYGHFTLADTEFASIHQLFKQFHSRIPS